MTALHLATAHDLNRLLPMISACHLEVGRGATDPDDLKDVIAPLLGGEPHGVLYIFGPARAPIGYVALSFGWSLSLGGLIGTLDEIWVRPGVRRRGIGTEVLGALPRALSRAGLNALNVEVSVEDEGMRRLYHRSGFRSLDGIMAMSRHF